MRRKFYEKVFGSGGRGWLAGWTREREIMVREPYSDLLSVQYPRIWNLSS